MAFSKLIRRKNCNGNENVIKEWTDEEMRISNHNPLSGDINHDEIPLLLDEVRQNYDSQLNGELQFESNAFPRNGDAEAAFEEALNSLQNENVNSKSCAKCSKHVRVENVETFRKGQHLAMPGRKRILGKFYKHHAILKEVRRTAGTRVEMELIHFRKEENTIEINKTTETYDLANDEIMIVEYTCPRYSADVIVRRAESMIRENPKGDRCFESYNLITQNCEHFATWCVVGQGESFQVSGLTEKVGEGLRSLFGEGSKIAKAILRMLFISSDEIAGALTKAMNLPEIVLAGASAIYLVYCIVMTTVHIKKYRAGNMCWSCLKGTLTDLWATFGVFGITSAITYIIFHFALPAMAPSVGVPLLIILILLSGALQWSVPKLRRALQSPFQVDKIKICKLTEIEIGDVVSLRYYGLPHDIIVTEVHEDDSSPSVGRVRGIHYGLPNVFGKREIIEEYFSVNLEKTSVKRFDCRLLLCNPRDNVVHRARKRLGETKWMPASNRSDNFCFWAKVRPRPRANCEKWDSSALEGGTSTQLSSLFIGKSEVHLMEEIQVGDVLQHDDVGILTCLVSLDGGYGRKFEIEQIIYESRHWIVRSKKSIVDLNKDHVYVTKFHPAHCHPMDTRAERAKAYLGKKGVWWTNDGFIEECIKLNP